ncbi:MAG: cadherin-like domain-containing protein [Rubripirellula sp.]
MLLAAGIAVADYRFTVHGLNGQTELFSSDLHSQTTASEITSPLALGSTGNGDPPRGLGLGGAWNETSEPTPSGGQPDYFSFAVTPDPGYVMSLAELSFQVRRNDQDSKNSFAVYYDEDPGAGGNNFANRLVTGTLTSEDVFDRFVVSLEGIPAFANRTTAVAFRYYAWGTAGVSTQRIDNIRVRAAQETVSGSSLAYYGDANRLVNPLDDQGNRVPDYSSAGYRNGNAPVPDVTQTIDSSRIVNLSPAAGDDMIAIQNAIDTVSAMTPDADGFRGIVQLSAGEFQISNQVTIRESGIVLRGVGDGDNPANSTILRGTGTLERSLIVVGEASGFASGIANTTHNIVDKYVPVGATSLQVDSTSNWSVGDPVIIKRPSTAAWISAIGMDNIPARSDGGTVVQWAPGNAYDQLYERVITRIEGDRVFLNAPLMNSLEQQYGGGTVFRYTFPRINNVGIENIRGMSDFVGAEDEAHARTFIELQSVEDAWVTNVTGRHFVYATVHATSRAIRVTVDDAQSLDPVSIITGGRRYPFTIDGQFVLMKNLYSEAGRHDFVNNSSTRNRGPNVFLNGTAVNSNSSTGPHQRWSSGTLYDTISTDNIIEARNRGNSGTGHGWAGANMVFWNTTANDYIVQNPPTAQNWVIGASGTIVNETRFGTQELGIFDAHETPIDFGDPANPLSSLYVAQRNQADSEASLDRREYVLGDYDLGIFDGAASADGVFVDSDWMTVVNAVASGQPVESFDRASAGQIVPWSFNYLLEDGESVFSAILTLGLRGTGGNSVDDSLWFDSTSDQRSFSSLGVTAPLATDATTAITMELTGNDLLALNDGRLNLAIGNDTAMDWATLDLRVGTAPIDAVGDVVSTNEDIAVVASVLTNDAGATLSIDSFTQGSGGSVTDNNDGTLTYTPNLDFFGSDSFSYTIRDGSGALDTATVSVTVVSQPDDPLITWANPAAITFGDALTTTQLNAATAVPGSFVYNPALGTVLNAGADQVLTVTFSPTDGANFNTVTSTVSIDVAKVAPTISWDEPAAIVFGSRLNATQLNAMADVLGTFSYTPSLDTLLSAGDDQVLTATFSPSDSLNFESATATVMIDVAKADPIVLWDEPIAIVFGTSLDSSQLSAVAGVAGAFAYDPPAGTILPAGDNQILSATFTPADISNYNTATSSVAIDVSKSDPVIDWASPASIVFGTLLDSAQLNATSDTEGTFLYTPAIGTRLDAGTGRLLSVEFIPADSSNRNAATSTITIDVSKADPTLAWDPQMRLVAGTPLGDPHFNATADLPGQFTYSATPGTVLDVGRDQSLMVVFTPEDAGNYNSSSMTRLFDVIDVSAAFVESEGGTSVSETGSLDTVSVVLNDRPNGDVGFSVSIDDDSEITLDSSALMFDPNNWDTPQFITLTGLPDLIDDGDQQAVLSIAIDSPATVDELFAAIPDQTIAVTNVDRMVNQFQVSVESSQVRVVDLDSNDQLLDVAFDSQSPVPVTTGGLDDTVRIQDLGLVDVITLQTGDGDDTVELADLGFASIDAGPGVDRVRFDRPGEMIDLPALASRIQNAEIFEIADQTTSLRVDFVDVATVTGGATSLLVYLPEDGSVSLVGDRELTAPRVMDSELHHAASQNGVTIEVVNDDAWRNPFDRFDVNRSGDVSALDALVVLNEMSRGGIRDLETPTSDDQVGKFYFDSNADRRISALDALVVINEMTRRSNQSSAEQVLPPMLSPPKPTVANRIPADRVFESLDRQPSPQIAQHSMKRQQLERPKIALGSNQSRSVEATDEALDDWLSETFGDRYRMQKISPFPF